MAKMKYYAVKMGHQPGIYSTWDECSSQVDGFSNAVYKSFSRRKDAEDYLRGSTMPSPPNGSPSVPGDAPAAPIVIYTDGACSGNPGPGGYGVVLLYGERRKELSAGFRLTTNNRMEILGCIAGLQALKRPCEVTIYSDSKYVVNTMTKSWALKWRKRGWKRIDENGQHVDALNVDLWAQMLELCDKHRVRFHWVRGHSGNTENERCDQLAREATLSGMLGVDAAYENAPPPPAKNVSVRKAALPGTMKQRRGKFRVRP